MIIVNIIKGGYYLAAAAVKLTVVALEYELRCLTAIAGVAGKMILK